MSGARGARAGWFLGGLALVACAAPVASWLATTPVGGAWGEIVEATMSDRSGAWPQFRTALAYLAIPTLLVLLLVMLWAAFRRSPRAALMLAAITLLANISVQIVKHTPFGLGERWAMLNPLSGHAGVVASIGLGWLVVAPLRYTTRSALATVVLVGSVGSGVMLAGWHTPYQVLCPLLICAGWALIGAAVLGDAGAQDPGRLARPSRPGIAMGGLGAVVLVGVAAALSNGSVAIEQDWAAPVVAAVLAVFAASAVVVGIVQWPASRVGLSDPLGGVRPTLRPVDR